jgi:succinate dehydrogenase / fumarate reductase, iron-sulfur subunit
MAARQISVQRFDAGAGADPYWQTYTVEMSDRQTLLDALLTIADRIDPTLAFRRTCRSGICGSCAGRVNGRACLLCQLTIGDAASARPDGIVQIQPLAGFAVLRDLVVDMEPFFEAFDRAGAWLVPNPDYAGVLSADLAGTLWPAMRCVMCGICARDQRDSGSLHPAAVARLLTLARDPRDAGGPDRLRALRTPPDRSFAEWLEAVCPKAVDVRGLVE